MFKRTADPAFDMEAPVRKDDSVRDYQYYSYHAIQPNLRSRIELQVHDTSKYFLPCEAFIEIEGGLVQANDTPYADNTRVGFVNNGIMALFESARYLIDGKENETIDREVAKDTSDDADHLPYIKARTPSATLSDDQEAAVNPERRTKPAGATLDIMGGVNGDFNLGFAT